MNYIANATISLPVTNLDKAERWYTNVLGLTTSRRLENPPWCELRTSVRGLYVGLAEVTQARPGDAVLTLAVENIESARDAVRRRGADASEITEIAGITRVVSILDPDGNTIMLREGSI